MEELASGLKRLCWCVGNREHARGTFRRDGINTSRAFGFISLLGFWEDFVELDSATVSMVPDNTVKVEGKKAESLMKLLAILEESDDVNSVAANYEIDDALMEQLMA